jgi:hypothetical protein
MAAEKKKSLIMNKRIIPLRTLLREIDLTSKKVVVG